MAFPRKLLNTNEELVLDLRPHWLALIPSTALLVMAVAVGIAAAIFSPSGGAGTVLGVLALGFLTVALVVFVVKVLVWANTNFVLTSDRIISRRGVVAKSGIEIPLERINTVFFNQSVFERMVGSGDLGIESAGERGSETFANIRRPATVQREIYVQMEDNENRKFDRIGSRSAGLSVAEQLEKLHELSQRGAISPAQFEAEKAKLLGS